MTARLIALLLALALPAHAATGRSGKTGGKVSGVSVTTPLGAPAQAPAPTLTSPALGASGVPQLPASAVPVQGREASAAAAPVAAVPGAQPQAAPAPASAEEVQPPAAAAVEAKPASRVGAFVARVRDWLFPKELDGSYSEKAGAAFFHGTSLKNIEKAAETGGALTPLQTYVSNKPGYPHGFARTAARKSGTPGVVLQFPAKALEGKLVAGHYSPVAHQDRGKPVELERWYMAVAELPLSALSADSKRVLLEHYALARDLAPSDAQAAAKLETVARALGEAVPAPRPVKGLSALEPGRRILIPEGGSAREALYAGLKDGKVLLVEPKDGAWLSLRAVSADRFPAVVDAGPASAETLDAVGRLHKLDWKGGSEAERLDRRFSERGLWGQVAPDARAEILGLRARKLSKAQLKAYVKAEVEAAFERIKAARGASNLGLHFNLHGGRRQDYVGAGIRASKGDIALRYSMHGDANDKVYFFQTAQDSPYDALDASNGEQLLLPSRMGSALSVFDLDAPELAAARADGRIKDFGRISMDFHGMPGVPYSAYLAPPLEVFVGTAKKVGLRSLSRDEETLAAARYLEAALVEGGADVPGGKAAARAAAEAGAAARAAAAADASPDVPYRFKLVDHDFYYHGTTLADVEAIALSGGEMKPEVSMFSQRAFDSTMYALERQRNLGRRDNPQVLLQFPRAALSPLTSGKAFEPMLAATDRGMPPIHAAYVAATAPVPLSLMTRESKESLLSWVRGKALRRPDEPRWARLAAALEKTLLP